MPSISVTMEQHRLLAEITQFHGVHERIESRLTELIDGQKRIDDFLVDMRRSFSSRGGCAHGEEFASSEAEQLLVPFVSKSSTRSKRLPCMQMEGEQRVSWNGTTGQDEIEHESQRISSDTFVASSLPLGWPQVLKVRSAMDDMGGSRSDHRIAHSTSARRSCMLQESVDVVPDETEINSPRCVIDPNSRFHLAWSMSSIFALMCDLIILPYVLTWEVEPSGFLYVSWWLIPIFWTADLFMNFFTAFYAGVELQKDFRQIRRAYTRTWFTPDLLVVLCDWISLLASETSNDWSDDSRSLKMLRFIKLCRLLRILDMLRILRLMRMMEGFSTLYLSEGTRLAFQMFNLLMGILWVVHMLACIWFGIGKHGPSDTGARWTDTFQVMVNGEMVPMIEAGNMYQYTVSFHWAAGQIALGGIDVMPVNSMERCSFAFLMLCGFLFGSTLVSTLSATMVDYRMMQKDKTTKLRMLRQYLRENCVKAHICVPVTKQIEQRIALRDPLDEKDVTSLRLLSSSLRNHLRYEIQKPFLSRHAIFRLWESLDLDLVHRICRLAVKFIIIREKDDLFVPGTEASVAYILVSGRLLYTQYPDSSPVLCETQEEVPTGHWICEAALWVEWIHIGRCAALSACKLLEINTEELAKGLQSDMLIKNLALEYCSQFHKRVTAACPPHSQYPTDLRVPFTDYCDLVVSMSPQMQVVIGRDALRHISFSGLGRGAKAIEKLEREVDSSKSIVVVEGSGAIIRVVSLVVLRLTNVNGDVLMQVGKWSGSDMQAIFQLPGSKHERDEFVGETISRFIQSKMPALDGKLEFLGTSGENTEKESKECGVQTRYLRSICSAQLKEGEAADLPICSLQVNRNGTSLFSVHMGRGEGEQHPRDPGHLDVAQRHALKKLCTIDVYVVREADGSPNLYAWLPPEQIPMLSTSASERLLQKWICSLSIPESMTDSGGIDEEWAR